MQFHIVAFLDILGFSHMVSSDAQSDQAKYLPIFRETIAEVRASFLDAAGLDVKMFSDSIIVCAPLSPENVFEVIKACADLQKRFLAKEILLRGGVSYGKHYSDETVIFSDGLINAYHLESKKARFPRVVIDKDLLDYFVNHPALTDALKIDALSIIRRDRDATCFVHYLTAPDFVDLTEQISSVIKLARLAEETVLEKMRWLHDYHSYCANIFGLAQMGIDGFQTEFTEVN